MTLEELKERIKDEIVLHEGNVAEWEWRQRGLTDEAQQLGLSPADFSRLVNQVSYAVAPDFGRISELKAKILETAQKQQKQLYQSDIRLFVEEADRARLSRTFVTDKWIPAILETIPDPQPEPPVTAPVPPPATQPLNPPTPHPAPESTDQPHPLAEESPGVESPGEPEPRLSLTRMFAPEPIPAPVPVPDKPAEPDLRPQVREEIKRYLDRYDKQIPAGAIQTLFSLLDYDEQLVAAEVRAYLTDHFYASVNTPQGPNLRAKLASTDWKHLSHWEQPQAPPVKSPTLPTPPKPVAPPKQEKSDTFIILLAAVVVLVLIALTVWVVKSEKKEEPPVKSTRPRRSASITPNSESASSLASRQAAEQYDDIATDDQTNSDELAPADSPVELEGQVPANASYDEVVEGASDSGLRAARKGKKWGFIDANGQWVITPRYESVGDFHTDRALVILNGKPMLIDANGNRIEE
ncbi:hypothetical protein GCM10023189_04900 [Nibrella saemangeumensis]|uniref:WG containing repeat-containing protein n=1 Tax=Nibrella saemangeumensis TaxID=1084526 RepID=A0ABP8MD01_9BACT